MAIYLDEDMLGADGQAIGFPHLLLCMGFVLLVRGDGQDEGEMWGVHLTDTGVSQRTFGVFADYLLGEGKVDPTKMVRIYGSCNHVVRYGTTGAKQAWKAEMIWFANRLGFSGPVRGFDTSIIDPKDGTYVEYQLVRPAMETCRVFYKRDEKMRYTKGDNEKIQTVHLSDTVVPESLRNNPKVMAKCKDQVIEKVGAKVGAMARRGPRNFGRRTMHEVDYANRMLGFDA